MALTAEGRALTEANRVEQLQIAARASLVANALWPRLDPADLDGSTPVWLAANLAAAKSFYEQSAATSAAYVERYRLAEIGANAEPVVFPDFDTALNSQALMLAGPVRVKLLAGSGRTGTAAHSEAKRKFQGIMRRQVMSGGRQLIDETTGADSQAIGWRRVSDGNPCAFCAMLCSRGPVYRSADRAGDPVAGSGLRYHGHCGCTAEIVYGDWKPNKQEQGFIDDYNKAAQEANVAGLARTQDSVLPRLRANGAFRDSPLSRNK